MAIFTKAELLELKRDSLVRLAEYYKVDHKGLSKVKLAESLLHVFDRVGVVSGASFVEEEPQMSVRVRRAKESIENG